jgi:hypothetical protein
MWLLDVLMFRRSSNDTLGRLAARVAHDSHRAVWSRVSHRVLSMRLNEARGYVRARAAHSIQAEVESLVSRNPQLGGKAQQEIVARATDHVVGLVIRDVLVMPAQTAARRRAA